MEKDFRKRNMFRISEPKAEEYLQKSELQYFRYGIDALDADVDCRKVPSFIMNAPDFVVFGRGTNNPYFFEVKTLKNTLKLKNRDVVAYRRWNDEMEVVFFIYDVDNDSYLKIFFRTLMTIIANNRDNIPTKAYPENRYKTYYDIPKEVLPNFTNF